MNKKFFFFLLLIIVLISGTINYTETIQKPINKTLNNFKLSYINLIEYIQDSIERHFDQANHITTLKQKLEHAQKDSLICIQYKNELKDLYKLEESSLKNDPRVTLVKAISYKKMGDMNKIWLDVKDYNASKIYGLVYNNAVAGIVVSDEGMPLALLNRDPKSSYAVFIGKENAPAIVHGENEKTIIATFIPMWYNIQVGDEVTTSGLDNIFFKGLKVGKVLAVSSSQGYKNAIIQPYYDLETTNYFYMIQKVN
ncbi:MAG: rod shape-determining protein MreC [Epsilonproteobacteria bacterium]|nr:rod shape-determining protein MreC [Campylobacterota bacterium]